MLSGHGRRLCWRLCLEVLMLQPWLDHFHLGQELKQDCLMKLKHPLFLFTIFDDRTLGCRTILYHPRDSRT